MTEKRKICTRCGYLRKEADDALVSDSECPKCGILYHKFESSMLAFDMVFNEKRLTRSNKQKKSKSVYVMMLFFVFVSLFFIGFISGRTYTKYEIVKTKQISQIKGQEFANE